MFRASNVLVFAAVAVAVIGYAGVCAADVVLKPPDVQVREGNRMVDITWTDPHPDSLVSISQPVLGDAWYPWRGKATLEAQGLYTWAGDWKFVVSVETPYLDTMWLRWDEPTYCPDPTAVETRRIAVAELDRPYDLSYGVQVIVSSEGIFEPDMDGWGGPEPAFQGIYSGVDASDPDTAVVFTFECTSSGDLTTAGGQSIGFDWMDDDGGSGSFTVGRADTSVHVDKCFRVVFPEGYYTAGQSFSVSVGMALMGGITGEDKFSINAETFDGYLVLRHSVEDRPPHEPTDSVRHFKVIIEISKCDSFEFFTDSLGVADPYGTRHFVDRGVIGEDFTVTTDPDFPTVHNGFPYNYAVVTYDETSGYQKAMSDTVFCRVFPAVSAAPNTKDVRVVPNPYRGRADWETGGESKVQFINIPNGAKIKIYDAAGGYINTVYPNTFSYGEQQGTANWNLLDSDGKQVVSGIYIYRIESKSGNELGRFIIVR